MHDIKATLKILQNMFSQLAMSLLVAAAIGLIGYTILSALGFVPWVQFPLQFGDQIYPKAGPVVQLGVTVLFASLLFFLPTAARTMRLEASHRRFQIGMEDVGRAYAACHAADRKGAFKLSHEFDAIKERLAYLRDHPDLAELEPDVLEVAAQMSFVSRDLAETYSDENVARARRFLQERQEEIERFNEVIDEAKEKANEIRNWAYRVKLDEDVARSELQRLRAELMEAAPELFAPVPVQGDTPPEPEPSDDGRLVHLRTAAE